MSSSYSLRNVLRTVNSNVCNTTWIYFHIFLYYHHVHKRTCAVFTPAFFHYWRTFLHTHWGMLHPDRISFSEFFYGLWFCVYVTLTSYWFSCTYSCSGSHIFKTVPSEGQNSNLLQRFNGERREKYKVDERWRYEGNDTMMINIGLFPLLHCACWFNHFFTVPTNAHLTLRRLMSYIYGAPILDVSRSHTTTQHSR